MYGSEKVNIMRLVLLDYSVWHVSHILRINIVIIINMLGVGLYIFPKLPLLLLLC